MRDYLIAGNWKMNGGSDANAALVRGILSGASDLSCKLLICPPFPYLVPVAEMLRGTPVALGAQNVSEHRPGAYTGEVAAAMLTDVGCEYVIVGHSERRSLFGESNATVAAKFKAALAEGLVPILCVGETLEQREAGDTEQVIDAQLDAVLEGAGLEGFARAVVAYEPVWAIGTGRTATPEQAQAVHRHIRERLAAQDAGIAERLPILYGGSVKGDNAAGLLAMPDIDGGLIGGASLKAEEFLAIARAAGA
ncbi:MAG TPA: triose-phosphate isomerase [Woeseiaceae bacterium]|nr:triose-phosphate isomerase [Woeseiaceae bacterium]